MNYYLEALRKFGVFSGRASRKEYWYFFLINTLIYFVLTIIDDSDLLVGIFYLATIVPHISVGVRRMHDVNKSGWFLVIPFYNLILAIRKGTEGDNKYGSNSVNITHSEAVNKDKSPTSSKYCSNCGKAIEGDSRFCVHCGNKIITDN